MFPDHAKLVNGQGNDIVIKVDWELGNDPNRPSKPSRQINLKISKEAVDDCNDLDKADKKLMEIVKIKLAQFNPEHDHPSDKEPPIDPWLIETKDLNS